MIRKLRLIACLVGMGGSYGPLDAFSATLHVPEQYPTITLAANAAVAGDSVLVDHPDDEGGEYTNESIVIKPGVSILGQDHDSSPVTIYHCSIVFANGTIPARLERFSVIPVSGMEGIVSNNSECEIRHNQVYSAEPPWYPGILLLQGGLVEYNLIWSFTAASGVLAYGNSTIQFNVIGTLDAGIIVDFDPRGLVVNIRNNDLISTGIALALHHGTEVNIVNNIFLDGGVWEPGCNGRTSIRYNDFTNGGGVPPNCSLGPGNLFNVDPLFCEQGDNLYALHASSPLVHAGEGGIYIGAYGVGCGVASVIPEEEVAGVVPLSLGQPFPNPTAGHARLQFDLATSGEVALEVFDVSGRQVAVPFAGMRSAGRHVVDWDGRYMSGEPLRAGVYYLRLSAGDSHTSRQIIIIK